IDTIGGNYVMVSGNYLFVVDWFLFKRSINMSEIARIRYGPQFVGGMGAKILTVYCKNDTWPRALDIGSNHFFSQQTLADITRENIEKNSGVQIDESVHILINKSGKRKRVQF